MITFKQFIVSEKLAGIGKIRIPRMMTPKMHDLGRDKVSNDLKDPLKSFRFKQSRGMNRKSLKMVPDKYSHSRKTLPEFMSGLHTSNKSVDIAKKAPSGIWRVSKGQVIDIARKYKFHVPNTVKPMKHLGSTGIQLIRFKPGVFYLYKPRKRKRKKTIKGVHKMITGITYPGG